MINHPVKAIQAHDNPGIRFYLGLAVFVASFFMLPIGLVLKGFVASHFWKGFILMTFWLSAPMMKISSVGILGKPTYLWIKYKMHHVYHNITKPHQVSRMRYNIGLFLFVIPFIPNYIISFAPHILPESMVIHYILIISADIVFLFSLFVLGGDFWDKLRALFVYTAKVSFNEDPGKL